jgi:GT2 family glycosyltransferase
VSAPLIARCDVGVVVIGRNEGARLDTCLRSVVCAGVPKIVYVDSGSTDGSIACAKGHGAHVVELDTRVAFTAARARNAGLRCLLDCAPALQYVQFVDGDCELVQDWISVARTFLKDQSEVGVVCGRRRERFPRASIYNTLCDIEWSTPVGEASACGGDVLMRLDAMKAVEGFREDMIAGEEPELCVRIRSAGWRIWRLDAEMTLHDAAMTRFGQWWSRTKRAGFAFAHGAFLHGAPPIRHWVREVRSACVWGGVIPIVALLAAFVSPPAGALVLLVYPLQFARLTWRGETPLGTRWKHAGFLILGKFPEFIGVMRFWCFRLAGHHSRLIEYK